MLTTNLPLTALEASALMRIAMRGSLEEPYRRAATRLLHHRLAEETAQGFKLTREGEKRCAQEARQRGLVTGSVP